METLQRTANRGSISTGFDIDNSLKFEADNSESMSRTPSGNGNLKTCTLSVWLKRTELKNGFYFSGDYDGAANPWFILGFFSDKIYLSTTAGISGAGAIQTNRVFRDTSAWYHIVVACDTTQSTAADRVKIYVNGVQETSFGTANYPSQNDDLDIMAAKAQGIGGYNDGVDYFYSGYMSEFVGIDGQQLDPTSFGEFDDDSGIWKPKDVSGLTFGTNGFYLDFEDASNLGNDASGGTDFSLINITAADQATDSPTNVFCTFNPTFSWIYNGNDASATILNGGTTADNIDLSPGTAWKGAVGTMAVNKGKWYWEWENNAGAFGHRTHGILTTEFTVRSVYAADDYSNQLVFRDGGTPRIITLIDGTVATPHLMTPYTSNNADVFGIALNMDDEEATFYRNGTAITISGTSTTAIDISSVDGVSKYVYPLYSCYGSTEAHYNFGGFTAMGISSGNSDENGYGNFEYAPPSGYYALCTKNLAEYG